MGRTVTAGMWLGLFLAVGSVTADAQPYIVRDLGTLGGYYSFAYGINASGQVVGNSEIGSPPTATHAFRWNEVEGMIDLGTLGGRNSYAFGINASGQAVGCSETGQGDTHAFLWTEGASDGVPTNPQMKDLGTLSGGNSCALGINDSGLIAGVSGVLYAEHAVIWDQAGQVQDIVPGTASGLNRLGQVAGAETIVGTMTDAFLWDPPNEPLDLVPGRAAAINESSQVVGTSYTGSRSHGFLYDAAIGIVDLGTLGCDCFSNAFGINNNGQVVGDSITLGEMQFAVLWDSQRQIRDLNDLIPPGSGWRLQEGRAINDVGQIVGFGYSDNGGHAFLLIPQN